MKYLITYRLFNNNAPAMADNEVTCTRVLTVDPIEWWESDRWKEGREDQGWSGCTVLNIFAEPEKPSGIYEVISLIRERFHARLDGLARDEIMQEYALAVSEGLLQAVDPVDANYIKENWPK